MLLANAEMPSSGGQVVKTPISDYTYGATVANERVRSLHTQLHTAALSAPALMVQLDV